MSSTTHGQKLSKYIEENYRNLEQQIQRNSTQDFRSKKNARLTVDDAKKKEFNKSINILKEQLETLRSDLENKIEYEAYINQPETNTRIDDLGKTGENPESYITEELGELSIYKNNNNSDKSDSPDLPKNQIASTYLDTVRQTLRSKLTMDQEKDNNREDDIKLIKKENASLKEKLMDANMEISRLRKVRLLLLKNT